ncbi:hypothetical protein CEV32_4715 [Brucella rhizosphaerae]|uniref:Uncharacterized protein n=1 Tax=Brucella rhizosphaerae TaxID=571254 RepID=A0A256FKR6_9HYPH|nr:hypothetical protein CEV32_4715 [Brucella rhizosphaerae]
MRRHFIEDILSEDGAGDEGISRSRVSQLFMESVNPSIRYVGLV